mgnify:CR=1 FL=1
MGGRLGPRPRRGPERVGRSGYGGEGLGVTEDVRAGHQQGRGAVVEQSRDGGGRGEPVLHRRRLHRERAGGGIGREDDAPLGMRGAGDDHAAK